ncbi:hypothetical protein BN59_00007 [Legionella massiliensis]|uniref:Uncharacterized protein n=1 Tax=Legionella massiliensis TaxID=1034943 RepID=A0A078KVF1_9GAMM|nr:hypothetical protein [Legionella massiliensis]CDZ75749.1 hypothetical protein BN59_00007 [Legionella massiliensis]CEE11487.1 hypothetical protein BN1094_00007 [Legionella massiliensis]
MIELALLLHFWGASDSHNRRHSDVDLTPSNIPFPVGNTDVKNRIDIDFDNADLMLSQILQVNTNIALRLLAGAFYLHFK